MTPKTELRFPGEKTKSDCGAFINEEDYSGYTKLEGLILSAAYVQKGLQWEMAERSPFSLGDSLILKENNKQLRFLSEDEVPKLLDQCPEYLRHIVECVLNTGMRRQEVLGLKWSQVRNGFVYLDKTKTNEARLIPINDDLKDLLKSNRKMQHLTSE